MEELTEPTTQERIVAVDSDIIRLQLEELRLIRVNLEKITRFISMFDNAVRFFAGKLKEKDN